MAAVARAPVRAILRASDRGTSVASWREGIEVRTIAPWKCLLAALTLVLAARPAAADPVISWRMENPFRFFVDPADTEVHRATYESLTPEQQRTPVLSAERALARRHVDGWASLILGQTCWDPSRNRYLCPGGKAYVQPASHVVVARVLELPDAANLQCTWLTAPRGGRKLRGVALTQPCGEPAELEIPYPDGAGIIVEVAGLEVASTEARVTDLLVVGMGDSFGSGEGNPDIAVRFSRERAAHYGTDGEEKLGGYPARVGGWKGIGDRTFIGENARWLDQACHRSLYSYQLRAALQLAIEDPHRAVTFVGLACSGAEVTDGLFLRYKGNEWVPNPPDFSQISYLAQAQCGSNRAILHDYPEAYHLGGRVPDLKGISLYRCGAEHARRIDLVLLSVGGNDVGFSRLVANAVLTDKSLLRRLGGWFGEVYGADEATIQLRRLEDRYKVLNRALHAVLHVPWDQADRIILTAYPPLALLDDGKSACPDGKAGMEVVPDFRLSQAKALEGSLIAEKLNELMRTAASEQGWSFAERHRHEFLGHGICAGWAELALSSVDDLRLPRKLGSSWEPYNPADYQPYASRQRWFRTPNDAFMTGNFHVSESLLQTVLRTQTLSWFQLLLAATYSGAFHPTAEGHAVMADSTLQKARGVLRKYARERTAQTQ